MPSYLDWLADIFEEAQVTHDANTSAYLDGALRKIAATPADASEEVVYRRLRERWLNHGQPGRQLLAGFLRDEVYSRRDSPMRPTEGTGYFTNEWAAQNVKSR